MQAPYANSRRSGSSTVETAIILTALMMLLVGAFDLGMGVFYQHILSEAARQGARAAIVHGSLAPAGWNGGPWGPSTYGGSTTYCNDSNIKAQTIAPFLTGLDPSTVTVKYEWPDNSNVAEKRVRVTLTTPWTPIMGFVFGNSTYTVSASSTMPIAH